MFLVELIFIANFFSSTLIYAFEDELQPLSTHSIPKNYTLDTDLKLDFSIREILLSPDENWILYLDDTLNSLTFFYRSRTQWQNFYSSVTLYSFPDQNRFNYISSWSFNQKGDLLFIGTYQGQIYKCRFSAEMTDQDCMTRFYDKQFISSVNSITVNSKGQIACTIYKLLVLSISQSGNFVKQIDYKDFGYQIYPANIKWHPIDQDILILGLRKASHQMISSMTLFNITKLNFTSKNYGNSLSALSVVPDGSFVFVGFDDSLNLYSYTQGTANLFQTLLNCQKFDCYAITLSLSEDTTLMIGYFYDKQIRVYSFKKTFSNQRKFASIYHINQTESPTSITYQLTQIFSIFYDYQDFISGKFAFSSDGNQILIPNRQAMVIKRYKLCLNNTYLSNMSCLECSSNCKTCHKNPNLCLTCAINYTLQNGICLPCSQKINACLTCSNSSFCLTCDTQKQFNSTPVSGKCVCQPFSYFQNNSCLDCLPKKICLSCKSQAECLTCNTKLMWKQTPVNGTCVCEDFYFNQIDICKPCDSFGACKRCVSNSLCTECDYEQGYQEKPYIKNQSCVCRSDFSTVKNKCILCAVSGCLMCKDVNKCSQCSQDQGYEHQPDKYGKCVQKLNLQIIIIGIFIAIAVFLIGGICIYCKRKWQRKAKSRVSLFREEEQINHSSTDRPKIITKVIKDTGLQCSNEERMRMEQLMKQSLLSSE